MDNRFQHIYENIVVPGSISFGCCYIPTTIVRFTRFSVSIDNITTATVRQNFVDYSISLFGVPVTIATDCTPSLSKLTSTRSQNCQELDGSELHADGLDCMAQSELKNWAQYRSLVFPNFKCKLKSGEAFASQLNTNMSRLVAIPSRQSLATGYLQKSLTNTTFVFVHHDAVMKPQQAPYDVPVMIIGLSRKKNPI